MAQYHLLEGNVNLYQQNLRMRKVLFLYEPVIWYKLTWKAVL